MAFRDHHRQIVDEIGTETMIEPTRAADRQPPRSNNRETVIRGLLLALSALLICGGLGYYAYVYLPFGGNGPRLQVDPDQLDLGDQHLDYVARASFEVKNTGDRPLNLEIPKTATTLEGC